MAGTLTISTLSDGNNSTSSTNCIQGSAKAWVNYNGATPGSIRASYNVSSVTYVSAGNYTVNFTNAFSDTNYAAAGICGAVSGAAAKFLTPNGAQTTTTCPLSTWVYNATQNDSTYVAVAFFR